MAQQTGRATQAELEQALGQAHAAERARLETLGHLQQVLLQQQQQQRQQQQQQQQHQQHQQVGAVQAVWAAGATWQPQACEQAPPAAQAGLQDPRAPTPGPFGYRLQVGPGPCVCAAAGAAECAGPTSPCVQDPQPSAQYGDLFLDACYGDYMQPVVTTQA